MGWRLRPLFALTSYNLEAFLLFFPLSSASNPSPWLTGSPASFVPFKLPWGTGRHLPPEVTK